MGEAVGLAAASAVAAQALFGESGGGIASRLHAALGGELSRARAEAAFAGAAGVSVGLVPDARLHAGPSASGRRFAALDASAAERTRDTRVRADDRDGEGDDGHENGERGNGERDGAESGVGGDAVRDDTGAARARAVTEGELVAIRAALASVRAAAIDIGCDGALRAIVLSGEALNAEPGAHAPCRLLILCFAPDGALGDTRHVWGFGYEEDLLVLTLDAVRVSDGVDGAPGTRTHERSTVDGVPARWRVEGDGRDGPAEGGGWRTARCEHVGGCHEGIIVTPDPSSGVGPDPGGWTLVVQDCSAVPAR